MIIRKYFNLEILLLYKEKYKKFLILRLWKFHFPKYKELFKSGVFSFFELGKLLPEI